MSDGQNSSDLVELRTRLLQYRASLFDPSTKLPTLPVVMDRVRQLLDEKINPAIAMHGGFAALAGIDGETAYLELGGGCQGCGLAAMTLRQGIETAILHHIPEVTEVVDVTDHASGTDPFYA